MLSGTVCLPKTKSDYFCCQNNKTFQVTQTIDSYLNRHGSTPANIYITFIVLEKRFENYSLNEIKRTWSILFVWKALFLQIILFIEKLATPWPLGWPPGGYSGWLLSGLPGGSLGGLLSWSYVRFPSGLLCRCPSGPTCRHHGGPSSSDWPMRPMSGLGHWVRVWRNKRKVVCNWLYVF